MKNLYTLIKPYLKHLTTEKSLARMFMACLAFLMVAEPAFAEEGTKAAVTTALAPIVDTLTAISSAVTGGIGQALAIIAIAVTGFGWMMGYIDFRRAMFIIIGIGIVMSAGTLGQALIKVKP